METETAPRPVHEGRNVKRIREIFGIKQEALAMELGLSQQAVSQLEQRETLDKDLLEKVAKALKVTPDAIKNFSEENTIYNIQHNYEGSNVNSSPVNANYCVFNPFEELLKAIEENKRLYERMLKDKDTMIEKFESLLRSKQV